MTPRRNRERASPAPRWRPGRPANRLRQARVVARCLPGLVRDRGQRRLLREMRGLCRELPGILDRPLPEAECLLTPGGTEAPEPPRLALPGGDCAEDAIRRLADLAALLERRSSVGKCLRRSALRYHFLRQLGLPLRLHLGARVTSGGGDAEGEGASARRLAAHAWVTLDGAPYFEDPEDVRGYRTMTAWPEKERAGSETN